jgi:hypothetical protein
MKSLKTIALSSVMLALTGCFAEDYSFCPPVENVTLNYRLPSDGGADAFLENVHSASTAIYNSEGDLVQLIETYDPQHSEFQGIKTTLEVGEYRVISWGNVGEATAHNDADYNYSAERNAHVSYRAVADGMVGSSDALYYAPNTVDHRHGSRAVELGSGQGNEAGEYILNVTRMGHEGNLDFRHAHRTVNVYVRNFSDGQGGTTPTIQLTDLPSGLNFNGMSLIDGGERVNAELPTRMVAVDGKSYALASFNTFLFHLNDVESNVHVVNPLTEEVVRYGTVHLHDVYDPAEDDPDSTDPIEVVIEFLGDTEVRVTIPNWNTSEVEYTTLGK